MSFRHSVKNGFYSLHRRIARTRAVNADDRPADRIVIFAMHAINDARSDMAVSQSRFRLQIRALLDAGYRALALEDLLQVMTSGTSSPGGFAITFDDGYETVYTQALPVLESLSIPAAVFLTTGFLNREVAPPGRSSDPSLLEEYRTQAGHFRPMSWEQARELARHPLIRIGSHTDSHPLLGTLPLESARRELADSKSKIGDQLGIAPDLFSYPFGVRAYGAYSDHTETLVREAGYRCSLTSEIARARIGDGPWKVPRMSLTHQDEGVDAVAKAAGAYDWVGSAQSIYQSVFPNPHKGPSE